MKLAYAVIIPVYNNESSIALAVESALASAAVRDVIVVDDGSSDGTAAVVRAMPSSRVTLLSQANSGPASARNAGAFATDADRLIFLDADDVLTKTATEVFDALRDSQLVRAAAIQVFPSGSEELRLPELDERPFPRGLSLAGSFAMSTELFRRLGGYDAQLGFAENTELLLRAGLALDGWGNVAFATQPTVRVRFEPGRNSTHYLHRRLASIERVTQKHQGVLAADPEMNRNYHGIAANLHRSVGDRRAAVASAARAAAVLPVEGRSVLRLVRMGVEALAPRRGAVGPTSEEPYDGADD
jgi:glycosyltransferase involved in cell wall biosynthesis